MLYYCCRSQSFLVSLLGDFISASRIYTLDSVIFWNTEAKKNMWFVVKILTFTSARWQTSFILDLTWHTDSCTSLLQRPPRSVDVASCTDPGQLKILHRSRASSSPCYHRLSPISPKHFFMPANCYATNAMTSLAAPPLRIIVEGSGVSSIKQLYQSQGFLRSNQIAETHGGGN